MKDNSFLSYLHALSGDGYKRLSLSIMLIAFCTCQTIAQIDSTITRAHLAELYQQAQELHTEKKFDQFNTLIQQIIREANASGHHDISFAALNMRFTSLMQQSKSSELDTLILEMDRAVHLVDNQMQCFYWYNKGRYFSKSNRFNEAMLALDKALNLLQYGMTDFYDLYYAIWMEMASVERQNKNYKKVQEIYNDLEDSLASASFMPKQKNRKYMDLFNSLGILGREIQDYDSALQSYHRALNYAKSPRDSNMVRLNTAILYEINGDVAKAMAILKSLDNAPLNLSTELRKQFTKLLIFEAQKDTVSYLQLVDKFVGQVKSSEFRPLLIYENFLLAIKYYFLADYQKAKRYIEKAKRDITEKESFGEALHKINTYRYLIDAALANQMDQGHSLQLILQERDSLHAIKTANEINKLHIQFQTNKKIKENQQLQAEKTTQQMLIRAQKKQLYSVGITAGIISLLLVLLGFQYKRLKARNSKISHQNEVIQTLHRELNHRVKNNLAFMSSLLAMQIRRIDSEEAKAILAESENRLNVLALVHTQLFRKEGDTHINIKDYITALVASLRQIFVLPDKAIDFRVNILDFEVHADDAMRLGLVINEAITNSVKHAFGDVPNPQISIVGSLTEGGKLRLQYTDNGPGQASPDIAPDSLGLTLINLLRQQLQPRYHVEVL